MSVIRLSFHTNSKSGVIKPHFNDPFFSIITLSSLEKKEVHLIVLNMHFSSRSTSKYIFLKTVLNDINKRPLKCT